MKKWIIVGLLLSIGLIVYNLKLTKTKRTITSFESIPESIDQDPMYIRHRNPLGESL
jgi:hypothetical protein